VPKRLALQNAEGIASFVAPAMRMLASLAAPVVGFLTLSTEAVLRLLGRHDLPETPVTEDDIMALVREGAEGGALEAAEESLIGNVFSFTERAVRSLMTPRTQIAAVDAATPFAAVLQVMIDSGHTRIPVYEGAIDQIMGILHVKDLLRLWGRLDIADLRPLLRQPIYVLESQRALVAFEQIKQQQGELAIVLDEYGQVAGLITLADLIEEVVGDIDAESGQPDQAIVRREDGSYLVDGLLPFVEVQEQLDLPPLAEEARPRDFETLAGFVLALLGRIPSVGDRAQWQGYTFEIVDMDERRIDKVLIIPPAADAHTQTKALLASGAVLPPPHAGEQTHDVAGEE
jgi:magnesium and cobalt exporter, CNNM family